MKCILCVDETSQGYKKEVTDSEELKKEVMKLIDENVLEISIKREPPVNGSQHGNSTNDFSDNRNCT